MILENVLNCYLNGTWRRTRQPNVCTHSHTYIVYIFFFHTSDNVLLRVIDDFMSLPTKTRCIVGVLMSDSHQVEESHCENFP